MWPFRPREIGNLATASISQISLGQTRQCEALLDFCSGNGTYVAITYVSRPIRTSPNKTAVLVGHLIMYKNVTGSHACKDFS